MRINLSLFLCYGLPCRHFLRRRGLLLLERVVSIGLPCLRVQVHARYSLHSHHIFSQRSIGEPGEDAGDHADRYHSQNTPESEACCRSQFAYEKRHVAYSERLSFKCQARKDTKVSQKEAFCLQRDRYGCASFSNVRGLTSVAPHILPGILFGPAGGDNLMTWKYLDTDRYLVAGRKRWGIDRYIRREACKLTGLQVHYPSATGCCLLRSCSHLLQCSCPEKHMDKETLVARASSVAKETRGVFKNTQAVEGSLDWKGRTESAHTSGKGRGG